MSDEIANINYIASDLDAPTTSSTTNTLTVTTDKADYTPGSTAIFTVTGATIGGSVTFNVADQAGDPGDDGDADVYAALTIVDGGAGDLDGVANGTILANWQVPDNGDANNATLDLVATDSASGATAATTFTDSAGSYTIKWYAADPAVGSAPFIPTYDKLTPSEYLALYGSYPTGSASDPFPGAEAFQSPAIPSNLDAVTSLTPDDMALGQIVPFFIEISVSGSTAPENGIITVSPEWLAKTTSGGNFGFDPAFGILAAFVDTGDPQYTDTGTLATVSAFSSSTLDIGTNNERIHGDIQVSGLESGDKVIVEVWVVLKSTIPDGVSGNVQTSIDEAHTGPLNTNGSNINTGNQTVPLLRVQEFFSADADISVIKSDDIAIITTNDDPDPLLQPGDTFTYTIEATNNSATTISNGVVVTDTLDSDLTFISATGGGSAIGNTVTWNVGSLSQGESVTLTVTVQVKNTITIDALQKELQNTVSISSITEDPNTANNTDDEPTNVLGFNPNFTITKTFSSITSTDGAIGTTTIDAAGDIINYTITVDNTGDQNLTDVTVTDQVEGGAVTNATYFSGDTNTNNILETSETWVYNASYTVLQADLDSNGGADGDIDNVATADTAQTDPAKTATAEVPVDQNPTLNIVKTASVASVDAAGDQITYTYTVTNTGNTTLTGVTVSDDNYTAGDLGDDLPITLDKTTLAPGETATGTLVALVSQGQINAGADLVNVGTADSHETGPDTDDETVDVVRTPTLNIVKTASVASVDAAGDQITYTYTVTNTGNTTLTGVTVSDDNYTAGDLGDDLPITLDKTTLAPGETATGTLVALVSQGQINAGADLVNVGTANSHETGPDTDDETVDVVRTPTLNIVKTASVASVDAAGDQITYTYTVTNTGNTTLTGVTVSDDNYTAGDLGDDLPITLDKTTLAPGETATGTLVALVSQGQINAGADLVNVGTANSNETGPDTDDETVDVVRTPTLNIVKTASVASVDAAGDQITYTYTVTNTGNTTLTGVTVSDDNYTAGDLGDDLPITLDKTTLAPGETATGTLVALVSQGQINAGADLVNVGTADSHETGPDTDDETVDVVRTPAIDITKDVANVDGDVGGTVDAEGDVINYYITVANAGNVTLTGVDVTDDFADLGSIVRGADLLGGNNDGFLDVGETWTFTATHTVVQADINDAVGTDENIDNTATATGQGGGTTVSNSDDAFVPVDLPGPGIRTPGFWGSPNGLSYWDGIAGGSKGTTPGDEFPDKDLAFVDAGGKYILLGDLDGDGSTDAGENTLRIDLDLTRAIINASNKVQQDARYVLLRDAIAAQLNFNAGNPGAGGEPGADLTEAVEWLKNSTPSLSDGALLLASELNSGAVKASSSAWQIGIDGPDAGTNIGAPATTDSASGSSLHTALDQYNNSGEIGTTAFAQDGDVTGSTAYQAMLTTYLQSASTGS